MKNSKNLWELIFGESRNGMSSASNIQHEMDFIKHHKNMKEPVALRSLRQRALLL
jgi:hypothetical protein